MRDRLYDVGRDKDFQAQQQRSPDADLVNVGILQGDGLSQLAIGGPRDAGHDDDDAEELDSAPDDADGVIEHGLQSLDRVHIVHGCVSVEGAAAYASSLAPAMTGRASDGLITAGMGSTVSQPARLARRLRLRLRARNLARFLAQNLHLQPTALMKAS